MLSEAVFAVRGTASASPLSELFYSCYEEEIETFAKTLALFFERNKIFKCRLLMYLLAKTFVVVL
jgi:hypothetical protein